MRWLAIGALAVSVGLGAWEDSGQATSDVRRDSTAATQTPSLAPASAATRESSREIAIPAASQLTVALDTPVGSDASGVEEPVSGRVTRLIGSAAAHQPRGR